MKTQNLWLIFSETLLSNISHYKNFSTRYYRECKILFSCQTEIKLRFFRHILEKRSYTEIFLENKETKLRIHNTTAKAALKFGSEAWVLKKREEQRLEAAQMKF